MAVAKVKLELQDVKRDPISESHMTVRLVRFSDGKILRQFTDLICPPDPILSIPPYPEEKNLCFRVNASRYRQSETAIFTVIGGKPDSIGLNLFRKPDKCKANFVSWGSLGSTFSALTKILDKSPSVHIRGSKVIGFFTDDTYDKISDSTAINAKACLLNLFGKLTELKEPVTGKDAPWFSFLTQILSIGRERFIAEVDPEIENIIRTVREHPEKFKSYSRANPSLHFENFLGLGYEVFKSKMTSIKSDEDHGNIQLTVAQGKDPKGNSVVLLDADIDENGKLLDHLADLLKHKFTGGTHPFDIHEYLIFTDPQRELGYSLV